MKIPGLNVEDLAEALSLPPDAIDAYVAEGMPRMKGGNEYSPLVCSYWLTGHRENMRGTNDAVKFSVSQKIAYGWLRGPCMGPTGGQTQAPTRAMDFAVYLCTTETVGIETEESIRAVHFAMAWLARLVDGGLELVANLDY